MPPVFRRGGRRRPGEGARRALDAQSVEEAVVPGVVVDAPEELEVLVAVPLAPSVVAAGEAAVEEVPEPLAESVE